MILILGIMNTEHTFPFTLLVLKLSTTVDLKRSRIFT